MHALYNSIQNYIQRNNKRNKLKNTIISMSKITSNNLKIIVALRILN